MKPIFVKFPGKLVVNLIQFNVVKSNDLFLTTFDKLAYQFYIVIPDAHSFS
jgi:hypothetical protein